MLEWILSSCVLTAVVILLRLLLKGRISLRLQYGLWALVLLRLLLPVSIGSSPISVTNLAPTTQTSQQENNLSEPDYELPPESSPIIQTPDSSPVTQTPESGPTTQSPEIHAATQSTVQTPVTGAPQSPVTVTPQKDSSLSPGQILRILWLCGMAAVGIWFAFVNLRMRRRLRATRRLLPVEGCSLPVYVSNAVDTPCLFGLFRPAVYLTEECLREESTLRYALIHEQTHYRHGDHLWSLLRCLCLALHWYNPLVWWAALLSQRDAELACDEAVLRQLCEEDRAPYGRALLQLTCEKRSDLLSVSTTMTGSAKNIKERIAMIVKKPRMGIYTLIAVILIAAIAVGCTFTGANTPDGQETEPSASGETTDPTETTEDDVQESTDNPVPSENNWDKIASPRGALYELFDARGEMSIWLELADGGCTQSFLLDDRWYAERFAKSMNGYDWTAVEQPREETVDYYVMLQSTDGIHKMKVYPLEVQYENGEQTFIWQATPKEESYTTVAETIRMEYDRMEELYSDATGWTYAISGSYQEAVQAFVERCNVIEPLTPGNVYAITDCRVINYTIYSVSEDERTVEFGIYYAFTPANGEINNNPLLAGGVEMGKGEYEGMWTTRSMHYLQKSIDGLWHPGVYTDENSEASTQAPTSPKEAFDLVYGPTQGMRMYLKLDNGEISPVLRLRGEWNYSDISQIIDTDVWEAVDPSEASSDGEYTVVLLSEDGKHMLSVSGNTLFYEGEDQRLCWKTEEDLAQYLRRSVFDNKEAGVNWISFSCEGTAEDAARRFVEEEFANHCLNLTEGNWMAYSEYRLMDWGVLDVNEEGTAVVLWFNHAFVPANSPLDQMIIGNGGLGTGEYEGMVYTYREIVLRQMSDGKWYCVGAGTGGVTLRDGF